MFIQVMYKKIIGLESRCLYYLRMIIVQGTVLKITISRHEINVFILI